MSMIIHNVVQGSDEWKILRLGIPTTSRFKDFITPTGKYRTGRKVGSESKMIKTYIARLCAQDATTFDPEANEVQTPWMNRGGAMQADANAAYSMRFGVKCTMVGFVENLGAGSSPDAFVGDDGLAEYKCLAPHNVILCHMGEGVPDDHIVQAHSQMVVCERNWCDLVVYHPELEMFVKRYSRNEYTEQVEKHLGRFLNELADVKADRTW